MKPIATTCADITPFMPELFWQRAGLVKEWKHAKNDESATRNEAAIDLLRTTLCVALCTAVVVSAFATATGAKCAVLVNGVEQEALSFPNIGSWSKKKAGKLTLVLKPGTNTIEIRNLGKRGINHGYLDLKPVK